MNSLIPCEADGLNSFSSCQVVLFKCGKFSLFQDHGLCFYLSSLILQLCSFSPSLIAKEPPDVRLRSAH